MTGADGTSPAQPQYASADTTVSIDLAFMTHLDMDLPEQDVFIEREPGSGEVWRVTKGDNDMNARLYRTAHMVKHDPFNPDAIGPYPKGEALGLRRGSLRASLQAVPGDVGRLDHVDARHQLPQRRQDLRR
ncbi:MAG: hypothetical protein GTO61_10060 [Gemmatimonadales bacterium]|nr:hypothetical protein [Gemmatimonadales bacterium]NIO31556.1 hypothetical protein [Gemmatimonadota bacterium]